MSNPHRFCVAPMLDWTTAECRALHRLFSRRAFLYTEMVTTGALIYGDADAHTSRIQRIGQRHFQTTRAFEYDKVNVMFFQVFDGIGVAVWVVRFGFGFWVAKDADNDALFGDINAAVVFAAHQ
ncbi:MAG: tRNA-dihydrouridine synthase [Cardiobacterium sp.]